MGSGTHTPGPAASANGRTAQAGRVPDQPGTVRRLLRVVSTAVVVVGLGAAAYVGHHTGWTFSSAGHGRHTAPTAPDAGGLAIVRFGPCLAAETSVPPALRRAATLEFESAAAVAAAGIDIAPAWRAEMTEAVSASGELGFDPARVARLSARAPGQAWRVFKTTGDPVKPSDVVALVDAAEVGKAKAGFQQALVQARLRRQSYESLSAAGQAASAQRVRELEAALRDAQVRLLAAEQALANLGLPVRAADFEKLSTDEVRERLRLLAVSALVAGDEPPTANLLPVRAPFEGVVLSADVVAGEAVEPAKVLFVVVDPSVLWLTLNVAPGDARRVSVGQAVRFRPDGLDREFAGKVTWVGTAADETTRTVPVRAELRNDSGQLRASTLGAGRVVIRETKAAVVVPHEAVRRLDGTPVVFVRDPAFLKPSGPKSFHVRAVRTGATDAQNVEILSGLDPNEVVATKGSGLLLDELKRALAARPVE